MKQQIEDFLLRELWSLSTIPSAASFVNIEDEIYRLLVSHKFRKYSVNEALKNKIKKAIKLNVENNVPLKIMFLQGCYKLWQLDEAPETDWAELFALMYYVTWLKPILAIYKAGIRIEFFVDDFAMIKIDNYTIEEIKSYLQSFQEILDFLKPYLPSNMEIMIIPNSTLFESEAEFWEKMDKELAQWKPVSEIILTEQQKATIDFNVRLLPGQNADPLWRENNARFHDAYIKMSDRQIFRNADDKIVAMPCKGEWLTVGSTKNTTMKPWVAVGALKREQHTFVPMVLSKSQIDKCDVTKQEVYIKGLNGKNFKSIRVVFPFDF